MRRSQSQEETKKLLFLYMKRSSTSRHVINTKFIAVVLLVGHVGKQVKILIWGNILFFDYVRFKFCYYVIHKILKLMPKAAFYLVQYFKKMASTVVLLFTKGPAAS